MTGLRTRWRESPAQLLILLEAGLLLLVARAALKIVPTARIVRWVRRPLRSLDTTAGHGRLEQVQWAVTAFSRNAPIRLVCFPQALAMYAMLRRRRIASEVLYGAARLPDGRLAAHAWLRSQGRVWVGAGVAPDFTVLDVWKPSSSTERVHPETPN
jgi:hypothetical protein